MYTIQTITHTLNRLTQTEKHALFKLVSENADLLEKIAPGLPLVSHARGQQVSNHPLAVQYDAWLHTKT